MPFTKGGHIGRPKGSKNHAGSTRALIEGLTGPHGIRLLKHVVNIALDPTHDVAVQLKAVSILAPLIWQKLPEVRELSGPERRDIPITFVYELLSTPGRQGTGSPSESLASCRDVTGTFPRDNMASPRHVTHAEAEGDAEGVPLITQLAHEIIVDRAVPVEDRSDALKALCAQRH